MMGAPALRRYAAAPPQSRSALPWSEIPQSPPGSNPTTTSPHASTASAARRASARESGCANASCADRARAGYARNAPTRCARSLHQMMRKNGTASGARQIGMHTIRTPAGSVSALHVNNVNNVNVVASGIFFGIKFGAKLGRRFWRQVARNIFSTKAAPVGKAKILQPRPRVMASRSKIGRAAVSWGRPAPPGSYSGRD
jgi:hypothetical protein